MRGLAGPTRARNAWLLAAAGSYAISLPLPALVHEGETVWHGYRAAAVALFLPVVWSQPLGVLLGMLYPLFGVTVFGILKRSAFATGASVALVATMVLWGLSPPAQPEQDLLTVPGGQLGAGFWVWLASGVCLVMASLEPGKALLRRWTVLGLSYAAVAAVAAFTLSEIRREAARHPTDAERREVEAEKRANKPDEPAR